MDKYPNLGRGRYPKMFSIMPKERIQNYIVDNIKKNEVIDSKRIADEIGVDVRDVHYHINNVTHPLSDGSIIKKKSRMQTRMETVVIKDPPNHIMEYIDEQLDNLRSPMLRAFQHLDENMRTAIKFPYPIECRCGNPHITIPIALALLPPNCRIPCLNCGHTVILKCICGRIVETAHLLSNSTGFCSGCGREYTHEGALIR